MRYHGMLIGLMGLFAGGAILSAPTPAQAAQREEIRLGVFSTMTGPGALIGTHLNNGVETAMAILGGKLGDIPAKLFYVDDQKPEIGRQVADELIKRRKVDFITGVIWSNVMVAVNGPITQSKTFLLGTVAGLGEFAGRSCSPYFFSASLQNDQMPQAVGKLMSDRGIKDAVVMTANYAGGRDNINGFKRGYSGKISGEIYFSGSRTSPRSSARFAQSIRALSSCPPPGPWRPTLYGPSSSATIP
jgi:branched-chain amino acid transport system substrate-binding protein